MRRITAPLFAALVSIAAAAPGAFAQDAQEETYVHGKHAIHAEMSGAAILGSVNYERMVGSNFSARVGVGYLPGLDYGSELLAPVMVNYIAGRGTHRLEIGAGAVLAYGLGGGLESDPEPAGWDEAYATATLAYRLEPGEGSRWHGGIYRIGFTPAYFDGEVYPLFGLSAGLYLSALRKSDRAAAVQRR